MHPRSRHIERAQLLLEQHRYALAEQEVRAALAEDPDDGVAHTLLAIALSGQERFEAALDEARRGVALGPINPWAHYAHAVVLHGLERYKEAEEAVRESIRLDPEEADWFAFLGRVHLARERWRDALRAAEEGLEKDATHTGCANVQALALGRLGRGDEAGAALRQALADDPENAYTHANLGWALLERGERDQALEHFREALRLSPDLDWARAGIVEALKARYLIYRVMLRYFFFMARLSSGARWGVIIGGYVAYRVLRSLSETWPGVAPLLVPLMILYVVFVLLTWIAKPLFNLVLRLNRYGRLALSDDQVRASNWVGGLLLGAGACAVGVAVLPAGLGAAALVLAVACGLMVLPVSGTFNREPKSRARRILAVYTAGLGAAALAAAGLIASGSPAWTTAGIIFVLGIGVFTWLANIVGSGA